MEHPSHEELTEFVYEELGPARQIDIERHLDACAECHARVASWRSIRRTLHMWELPPRRAAMALSRTTRPLQIFRWAAAIIMLCIGYGIGRITVTQDLRAELAQQLRGELRDDLHAELTRLAA